MHLASYGRDDRLGTLATPPRRELEWFVAAALFAYNQAATVVAAPARDVDPDPPLINADRAQPSTARWPAFAPIRKWVEMSGMTRTGTYLEIKRGNLVAVKCGRRSLIDVEVGLAYLRGLPQVGQA